MLKALFILEIFKILCRIFRYIQKQWLDEKIVVSFKVYDVTD